MTLAHQDIRDRLVDYLFGELDGPARAAFDEHLAGCESCRETVDATAKARAMAREVVRAPLDEPVPLGVRSRVLAAAAAAAEERRAAASTTTVAAAAAAAIAAAGSPPSKGKDGSSTEASSSSGDGPRGRAGSPRPGWFDWLRGRWAFPTLATVAAMAAFFLVRGTILREARHPIDEETAEKLASPGSSPASGAGPEAPVPAAREAERRPDDREVRGQLAPEPAAKTPATADGARAASAVLGGAGKGSGTVAGANEADRRGGVERSRRQAATPAGPAPRAVAGDALGGLARPTSGSLSEREEGASRTAKPPPAKPAARPARAVKKEETPVRAPARTKNAAKADLDELGARADEPAGFASPPPPAPAAAPSGGAAADRDEPAAERRADKKAKEPREAKTRAAAEVPGVESAQDDEGAPAAASRAAAPAARPTSGESAPSAASAAPAPPPDPARALAQRADQLLAARRWTEASAAYRDLLRRFPTHPSAPQWRIRLAAADRGAAGGTGSSGFATPPPAR